MCDQFVGAFQGGFKRPSTVSDLHKLSQKPGENLRQFTQRFCQVLHTIPKITPEAIVAAYHMGVRDSRMRKKMSTRDLNTTPELFALADKCGRAEEGRLLPVEAIDEDDDSTKKKICKCLPAKQALAAEPESKKTKTCEAADLDGGPWCPIHNSPAHTLKDCSRVKSMVEMRTHGDCFICLKPGHHAKACPDRRDREDARGDTGGPDGTRGGRARRDYIPGRGDGGQSAQHDPGDRDDRGMPFQEACAEASSRDSPGRSPGSGT